MSSEVAAVADLAVGGRSTASERTHAKYYAANVHDRRTERRPWRRFVQLAVAGERRDERLGPAA